MPILRHAPDSEGWSGGREVKPVHLRRLSHMLIFTPSINRSIAFYRDALGLRLSDRSGDLVAFMHARHGSDHHLIAFAASSAKGWHHSAWDVAGVDEVGGLSRGSPLQRPSQRGSGRRTVAAFTLRSHARPIAEAPLHARYENRR